MASSRSIARDTRREQIVAGALEVFSSKGFADASMRDVAAAAEINSPGLIYHYFASKEELFQAVVAQYAPPLPSMVQSEQISRMQVPDALLAFANTYLEAMEDDKLLACVRAMLGEALRTPKFAEIIGQAGPQKLWGALSHYMKDQMDKGNLRRSNPDIAARCFLGPLFTFVFVRKIAQMNDTLEIDRMQFAREAVDLFLHGCGS